ncbi:MAG: transcriptional regulator, GntR family [Gemmataceae bacterium]|nr:transcriptional regulator, GntR family [Gemmataceae bacterium]
MAAKKPAGRKDAQTALARAVFEGLRDEITGGKLRPGQVLSRRQVASRYGTSYIPVIEAMARLESAGLIDVEARQVARVRTITLETIQDDYVLREAYETQAVRLACEAATPGEIEDLYRLADAVDEYVAAGGTKRTGDKEGPLLHWQFHRRIAEVSRCRALVRELERIELLRRLQANWYFAPEVPDLPRCHALLVDAIESRNPAEADASMRAHVRSGLEKELLAYRMNVTPGTR